MQQLTTGSRDAVFDSLANYPFDTDSEFFSGLSSILGHPDIPPTPRELEDHAYDSPTSKVLLLHTQTQPSPDRPSRLLSMARSSPTSWCCEWSQRANSYTC